MITYLKKLNKDSTSGPLGITVTHLLLAGHETHEALLLLTQAAFAGIHASSSAKYRPVALQEITHKLVTFTVASRLAELLF